MLLCLTVVILSFVPKDISVFQMEAVVTSGTLVLYVSTKPKEVTVQNMVGQFFTVTTV